MKTQKILVVDGHDGAGKTTIAKRIAEEYGMKYVKPFSDSLGDLIAWSYREGKYSLLNDIAMAAVEKQLSENKNTDVIFDRHWMSMFSILPKIYHSGWEIPTTICCWADIATTLDRLRKRDRMDEEWDHEHFCLCYKEYAIKYGIMLLDTSLNTDVESNLQLLNGFLTSRGFVKNGS